MSETKKPKLANADKDKKPKLVRDSFTMPKNEYAAIDSLKQRALQVAVAIKKSELLRAGLMALQAMDDAAYKKALAAVPTLKTGRPSTQKTAEAAEAPKAETVKAPAKKGPVAKKAPSAKNAPVAQAASTPAAAPRKAASPRAVKAVTVK